jgi:ribosome-associated protein
MKIIEYPLTHASFDYIELNHLLKLTGFADSGGSGGALVTTGVVRVDGQIELRKRNKIRAGQIVQIEDTEIHVILNPEGAVPAVPKAPKPAKVAKPAPKPVAQPRRPRGNASAAFAGKPATGKPATTKPATAKPAAGKPKTGKPKTAKPSAGKPTTPRAKSK